MARKSRHVHNRYRMTTTKRKEEQRSLTSTIRRPTSNLSSVITPSISKVELGPSITTATKISDKEKYAYVKSELLEVGILTAVILAVLVILALFLH